MDTKERILQLSINEAKTPTREDVIAWLKENPNPKDSQVHAWAEELNYDTHKLESIIYTLASDYAKEK